MRSQTISTTVVGSTTPRNGINATVDFHFQSDAPFKSEVMFSIKALEAKSKVYLYGVFVDMKENLSVSPFSFVIISFLSLSSIPAKFCTAC